jgi:hypothetical protein
VSSKLPFSRRNEYNDFFSVKKQKLSDTIYRIKKKSICRAKQSRKIVPFELPFYERMYSAFLDHTKDQDSRQLL